MGSPSNLENQYSLWKPVSKGLDRPISTATQEKALDLWSGTAFRAILRQNGLPPSEIDDLSLAGRSRARPRFVGVDGERVHKLIVMRRIMVK